jgi:predicted  nucleic acid-binding Zn-ribbon protein
MTVNIIQKLSAEIARIEASITPGTNEEMAYALSAEVRVLKRQIRDLRRSAEQSTSS